MQRRWAHVRVGRFPPARDAGWRLRTPLKSACTIGRHVEHADQWPSGCWASQMRGESPCVLTHSRRRLHQPRRQRWEQRTSGEEVRRRRNGRRSALPEYACIHGDLHIFAAFARTNRGRHPTLANAIRIIAYQRIPKIASETQHQRRMRHVQPQHKTAVLGAQALSMDMN